MEETMNYFGLEIPILEYEEFHKIKTGIEDADFVIEMVFNDINLCFDSLDNLSVQKLYFVELCNSWFSGISQITLLDIEKFNIDFLSWQNCTHPNISFINKNIEAKNFSHSDDFRWDDLNIPLKNYLIEKIEPITCLTNQEHLQHELLNNDCEFPF
jgi:hypothetical protein